MMSLEQIEARLDDSIRNGTDSDIHYWRGYRDAMTCVYDEIKKQEKEKQQ